MYYKQAYKNIILPSYAQILKLIIDNDYIALSCQNQYMINKAHSQIISKAAILVNLEIKKPRPFKPIIISDIDGVLVRGQNPIPQTAQAMKLIRKLNIPFACLTNGGGRTEKVKTQGLNKYFKQNLFQATTMFLNHTPLKPQILRHSKMDGNLLISGSLNIISIMQDLNIKNYITADEFFAIYFKQKSQKLLKGANFQFHQKGISKQHALQNTKKRLNRELKSFQQQAEQINSIFALNDVSPYETTLAVIHNILLQRKKKNNRPISYFAAQNDVVWAGQYHKPRLAFGPFNIILDQHCKKHNLQLIQHIYYGKPQLKAFRFVQSFMKSMEPNGVFFMMGDNPRADIRGANNIGWYSFLTRTGIHLKQENDPRDPATFVVKNFNQAVQIIIEAAKHLPK